MSFLSHLVTSIAISDLDLAMQGLQELTDRDSKYYPTTLKSEDFSDGDIAPADATQGGEEPPPDPPI